MNHRSPGGATPRACTVGEPKGDQTMEDKVVAPELAVKELAKAPRTVNPKDRQAISEFKVMQKTLPPTDDKFNFRECNTKLCQ